MNESKAPAANSAWNLLIFPLLMMSTKGASFSIRFEYSSVRIGLHNTKIWNSWSSVEWIAERYDQKIITSRYSLLRKRRKHINSDYELLKPSNCTRNDWSIRSDHHRRWGCSSDAIKVGRARTWLRAIFRKIAVNFHRSYLLPHAVHMQGQWRRHWIRRGRERIASEWLYPDRKVWSSAEQYAVVKG